PALTQGAAADQLWKAPESNPKRGGTFRYVAGVAFSHYDLHQGGGGPMLPAMYEGLVRLNMYDGFKTLVPGLATRWEVSPDGKVYTFYLRQGVKFHDGTPFSADDVVATFQRLLFPPQEMISVYKDLYGPVAAVEKVDNMTVRFTLKSPWYVFLNIMADGAAGAIYSKKTLDANSQDLRKVEAPPGTGAFMYKEYKAGESLLLVKNP